MCLNYHLKTVIKSLHLSIQWPYCQDISHSHQLLHCLFGPYKCLDTFPASEWKKKNARIPLLQTELHTFYNSYSKLHRVVELSIWRCRFQPHVPWAHCKPHPPGQQNACAKATVISLLLSREVLGNAVKLLSPPINWLKIKTLIFQFSFSSEHPASCLHLLYLAGSFSTLQKCLLKYTNSNLQFHFIFLFKTASLKIFFIFPFYFLCLPPLYMCI